MPTRERRLREAAEQGNGGVAGALGSADEAPDTTLDDLVAEFSTEIPAQESAREPTIRDFVKWQRLYLGKPHESVKTYPFETGSSNVVVPIAGEDVERMRARIMQTIFGIEPLWNVKQRNKKWAPFARPLERFMDAIRSDVFDIYAVIDELVLETLKLGTSALYMDWIDQTTYRYDDVLQATVPAGRVIGPAPRWKSIEDVLVPQGYANHQTAPWCAVRERYSMARLRELEFARTIENVDKLEGHEDSESKLRQERRPGSAGKTTSNPAITTMGTASMSGSFDIWTVFFRRDLDEDGYPEEYVMMIHAATKTMLRFKPNPYPSAMRPIVVARFIPIEGEFYGIGIPQMVEHQQEEASTIHNERRDAAHLANIIMYITDMTSTLTDTVRPQMGKVLKVVGGPANLQQLRVVDNRQVNIYEESVVVDQAQRRVGTNDLARGQITSPVGRAAATTSMIAAQEGAQLHDMNISAIRRALEELGIIVLELYQTHGLPAPDEPGSPESFLDEPEAALVRELLGTQDNLRGMVKVKLNASTSSINRAVEKQELVQLIGILQNYVTIVTTQGMQISSPMVAPELKVAMTRALGGLDEAVRDLLQAYSRYDLESILSADLVQNLAVKSIETQAMMAQMGDPSAIMGGGGDPSAMAAPQTPSAPAQPTGAPGSGPTVSPYEPGAVQ